MKKVKSGILSMQSVIIIILCNLFVLFYALNKDITGAIMVKSFIFINVLSYFLVAHRNHYFTYNKHNVEVKNSVNLLKYRQYGLKDIEKMELKIESFVGLALRITLKNGAKKTYPTDISRNALEEMIKDIEKIQSKNKEESTK